MDVLKIVLYGKAALSNYRAPLAFRKLLAERLEAAMLSWSR